jgi:uncharacterized membrane protein/uncharacterized membrane protein YhdT
MIKRTQTADLLKGIAAILMIQVHIIELFATQDIYNSYLGKILLFLGGPPVAPVFIIIFGYFIAHSKKSPSQLIIRGLKIILLGLLLNIALNFNLIISVSKGIFNIDIWPYIFGIDILPMAGLSLIVLAVLSPIWRMDKNFILILFAILILSSAFLGNFLLAYTVEQPQLKYVFSLLFGVSTWSYFPLFPWLSYSLAGVALYKIIKKIDFNLLNKSTIKIIVAVLFSLFLTLTIPYAISIASDLPAYYHHGLIFFLWVISFLAFYSFFINETEKMLGSTTVFKYLKWLGQNITILYVIQWIIIGNSATEIYKTVSNPLFLFLSFLAILFISSIICYIWIMIKMKIKQRTNVKC